MTRRLALGALLLSFAVPGRGEDEPDPYGGRLSGEFLSAIMERKPPGAPPNAAKPGAAPGLPSGGAGPGSSEPGGADSGSEASAGSGEPAPSPAASAEAVSQGAARSRAASRSAARAAEALKTVVGDPGAAPAAAGGAPANRPPGGSDEGQDLRVAAASGLGVVFKEMGLKTVAGADGRVRVVDSAGRPASAAELALLKERLAAEPRALLRRPDFYEVLPRARFQELKNDYHGKPRLSETAFKHMGLTAGDRDFRWSQSCQQISGECNRAEADQHYKKGSDVAPETLMNAWELIRQAEAEQAASDGGEDGSVEAKLDALRAKNLAASRARTRSRGLAAGLRSRWDRLFGARRDDAGDDRRREWTSGIPDGASSPDERGDAGASGAPLRPGSLPPPSPDRAEGGGRSGGARLAAVAAAGIAAILIWLRRRRTEPKGEHS